MRFAHIADTHIRNLKYHKEYRVVFEQLYESLKKEKVDYIIHCGDIAHTKTQISPEFVEMCSSLFKNLADIAPTHIIPGNHDGNLRNSSRLDALTPIVEALQHPSLYLHKDSGEVKLDDTYALNILSVFDRENWVKPSDTEAINIALYHGAVSNSKTDIGWVMEHGEDDISIFDDFDYAFLGDIHKTNQSLDKKGKIRYAGSTVQQNHGETNDKGYLVWDIKDRDTFTCRHIQLKNPKPFVTIELTPRGKMPKNASPPEGARLRLVANTNLSLDIIRRAIEIARYKFKPEAITFLNKSNARGNIDELANSIIHENLRDLSVQEELISEYLKDYEVSDEMLELVYNLNKKYNTIVEEEEDVTRNINWKLKNVEWDNLFNYGEGNSVNFENTNGLVGIFGKNFSGKSSVIDSVLYTMFNTTSKNNRKNLNVINQNKDKCSGRLEIDIGYYTYVIERQSEKYIKRLKGEETVEAKTDLEFYRVDSLSQTVESLNGTSRQETDRNIRKFFGTYEDFLLTSMASQLDSLSFINEGSTRRKEILAKFLDLEIFEKKFKLAKEDVSDMRGALRRLETREFPEEIAEAESLLEEHEKKLVSKEKSCKKLTRSLKKIEKKLKDIDSKIDSAPTEIINIRKINDELRELAEKHSALNEENANNSRQSRESLVFLEKMEDFISSFDGEALKLKLSEAAEYEKNIAETESEISILSLREQNHKKKLDTLDKVPCGDKFPTCRFICDAHKAKDGLSEIMTLLEELKSTKELYTEQLESLEVEKVKDHRDKFQKVLIKKGELQSEISQKKISVEKNRTLMLQISNTILSLQEKKNEYEANKESIENMEQLVEQRSNLIEEKKDCKNQFEACNLELMDLYKEKGSLEQKLIQAKEQYEEYQNLRNDYAAYDLFLVCMHSNGISYDVIKKKLPLINDEVSKVLANIVDFDISFENEEKKLDILIKHPKHEPRPIEMGSGAEKTVAAMAIRLALLNVSTLPKGDVFILDEPGTALDEENMEGFTRILDMIKTQFKTVVLISHLDTLKDCVDSQIIIEKNNGYAFVEH